MEVKGISQSFDKVDVQALAVPVFTDEKADKGFLKTLDSAVGGMIRDVIEADEFTAKDGETAYFQVASNRLKVRRLLLIGCGDRDSYKAAEITQVGGTAVRFLRSKNVKTIAIAPRTEGEVEKVARTVVVGAIMGLFEPDKYRTKEKEEREIEQIVVVIEGADKKALQIGAERGRIIEASINLTRDLANEPGGFLTPTILAERAQPVPKKFRLTIAPLHPWPLHKFPTQSLLTYSL